MKKILLLVVFLALFINVDAQKQNKAGPGEILGDIV